MHGKKKLHPVDPWIVLYIDVRRMRPQVPNCHLVCCSTVYSPHLGKRKAWALSITIVIVPLILMTLHAGTPLQTGRVEISGIIPGVYFSNVTLSPILANTF